MKSHLSKTNPFYYHVNLEIYYKVKPLLLKFQIVVWGLAASVPPRNWVERQILRVRLRLNQKFWGDVCTLCFHKCSWLSPLKPEKHGSILASQCSVLNSTSLYSQHHPVRVTWTTGFNSIWYMSGTQLSWMTQGHIIRFIYLLLSLAIFGIWHINIVSVHPPLKLTPILLPFTYF